MKVQRFTFRFPSLKSRTRNFDADFFQGWDAVLWQIPGEGATHFCNRVKMNPPLPLPRGDLMDVLLVE
jgi:hypothetical protein